MSGSLVHAVTPQRSPRERVKLVSRRTLREDCLVDRNVTLEDSRERAFLLSRRASKVHRPGCVDRAVEVVGARVVQVGSRF